MQVISFTFLLCLNHRQYCFIDWSTAHSANIVVNVSYVSACHINPRRKERKNGLKTKQAGWQADKADRLTRQTGWQGRQADKADRLTRQTGWQCRQADKADRLTRETGWQGSQADKADRLTRQTGWQGRQADKADRLTRQTGWQGLPNLFQACLLCFFCPLSAPLFGWSGCFYKLTCGDQSTSLQYGWLKHTICLLKNNFCF